MSLPSRDTVLTGQFSGDGSPWVQVTTKPGIHPDTLEYSGDGSPWWAAYMSPIKKVGSVSWASIKKIGGILIDSIKKLGSILAE